MQRQKYIEKSLHQKKNQFSLYRKYRYGELPDIQIDYKDVLMPLMAIVRADSTIATEIFVEIF
jgi:DNA-dependent protein kinase catalytic subunit